jgi:hypothetical protein
MLFNHILIALLLAVGCSSSKNQSGENKKPDEATQTTTASATTGTTSEATETISHDSMTTAKVNAQTNDNNYRLIVSFISIGEGTDIKAHEKFDAFMSSWQTENNKTLVVEKVPWGREGEVDYCLKLNELDKDSQSKFVSQIQDAVKDSKLVQISENQPCMHKR